MKALLPFFLLLGACSSLPRTEAPANQSSASDVPAVTECTYCAEWNEPRDPVRVYGNTYYVGTNGLGAVLVTSPEGHILIDGALNESAALIEANIEALGFRMEDVKLILNSHAHFDHSGGLAALQEATGATVAASAPSAAVLEAGVPGPDDPQHAELLPFPMRPVNAVRVIADGETVRVGPLALTAHFTPGHTAGGTTWTWTSCEGDTCLNVVYADSLTPISDEGYQFSRSERYPSILSDFEHSYEVVEGLSCDVLITPHPGASGFFERLESRQNSGAMPVDTMACSRYAAAARDRLAQRLESER